jgi:hypothetical protein
MTARFLALYETPTDPEAFGRHYRKVHIGPGRSVSAIWRRRSGWNQLRLVSPWT